MVKKVDFGFITKKIKLEITKKTMSMVSKTEIMSVTLIIRKFMKRELWLMVGNTAIG
jgi:hypothetical protein